MPKDELRRRIENDHQLQNDFDFVIAVTGLTSNQLLTGLCLDCNLMKAGTSSLIRKEIQEIFPIRQDSLRKTIRDVRRVAREIKAVSRVKFSLSSVNNNPLDAFSQLPETLSSYASKLERLVDVSESYWKNTKSRIPSVVALTRKNSLYERIRSSAGKYHQNRLLRLINEARDVSGYPKLEQRTFTVWLNRLEKRRKLSDVS